ncbi:hypothetical protein ERX35_006965 [Macrococcus equipercicus]|uniref:Polysaccharide chain length determinant N-terminal domain-containing protein n=1 Tax=Macrococcus equipercicus TaxID=69967 RepID=A0ABQ6R869_9STAP|nr:Wzz/FepE/Etk N-terminal domain-containing protein [Macrococcus equipercicus]KAA1039306.1 hypothetical protein ERX35_006965 [Macrococcus equipercicus]
MQSSIDLMKSIEALKRGWKIIIGLTIFFSLIASLISYFLLTPIYQSEVTLLVNQETHSNNNNDAIDLQTNLQSISTYANITHLPDTLLPVIDKLNLKMEPEELAGKVNTKVVKDSTLLTIVVNDPSQKRATDIANEIANTMVQQDSLDLNNLIIASKARVVKNPKPIEPTPLINMFVGALLGFLIGTLIVLGKSLSDRSLKTSEEVEREIGVSVIGNIPYIK